MVVDILKHVPKHVSKHRGFLCITIFIVITKIIIIKTIIKTTEQVIKCKSESPVEPAPSVSSSFSSSKKGVEVEIGMESFKSGTTTS